MNVTQQEEAQELAELGARYWAGEAEIVRAFFSQPRTRGEHLPWLRLQCHKEMFGSGLLAHSKGIIFGLVDRLQQQYARLEKDLDRHEYQRIIRVLYQEFNHYCLFADILEELQGRRPTMEELASYQMPEDRKLQELRQHIRRTEGKLGEAAIDFTEGGRSAIFYVGKQFKGAGDPLLDKIARACEQVFLDELEHQEHGAGEVAEAATTPAEWAKVRRLVEAICQQRLRMRYEMFDFPVPEGRLREIAEGRIEPLHIG